MQTFKHFYKNNHPCFITEVALLSGLGLAGRDTLNSPFIASHQMFVQCTHCYPHNFREMEYIKDTLLRQMPLA